MRCASSDQSGQHRSRWSRQGSIYTFRVAASTSRCFLAAAAVIVVSSGALTGCRHRQSYPCEVRLINAAPDAVTARIAVDGHAIFKDIAFRGSTRFKDVPPGEYEVYSAVEQAGGKTTHLPVVRCRIQKGHRYWAIIVGNAAGKPAAHLVLLDDAASSLVRNKTTAKVMLFNASPDAGNVDIIVNRIAAATDLEFGQSNSPISITYGAYDWSANKAGEYAKPCAGPDTFLVSSGKTYLLVVEGQASTGSLSLQMYPE